MGQLTQSVRWWAVVLAATGTIAGAAGEQGKESKVLKPGTPAPTFMLPSLDGTRVSLRTWCGDTLTNPFTNKTKHTVILSYWATYCKPCQKEIPQLSEFQKKYKAGPLKTFLISIDKEGAAIVEPFVKEKGYDLPVLLDQYGKTAERYGVKSVPALFVIGPNGVIQYSATGFDEGTDLVGRLEQVLAGIAAGKAPDSRSVMVAGEAVAVKEAPPAPAPAGNPADNVPPQQRWRAVARVECGEKLDDVAREAGVGADDVRQWYEELKRAAVAQWTSRKAP